MRKFIAVAWKIWRLKVCHYLYGSPYTSMSSNELIKRCIISCSHFLSKSRTILFSSRLIHICTSFVKYIADCIESWGNPDGRPTLFWRTNQLSELNVVEKGRSNHPLQLISTEVYPKIAGAFKNYLIYPYRGRNNSKGLNLFANLKLERTSPFLVSRFWLWYNRPSRDIY